MEETIKIDRNTAEAEFDRFAACARIKLNSFRNDKEQTEIEENKARFIEGVMDGRISVDDEGWPEVHIEDDDLPVVSWRRRPRGVDRCAMDRCKSGAEQYRTYAWVGSIVGISGGKLSGLDDADWKRIWLVHELFLAA